ncbi:ComF family protein [Salinimicrobium sediminilitoris]|uniref:ComF family protein n=1 Tax=Salinimicrobium sediminilitoris TaxID=2876715 RepID=UPI001E41B039|nr:phosphoribosyltransferase family protein [Salinimicrobium sediminilitoris]MCC8359314.1 ComF family protein [Salinimicrobium sediminilitoris]
MFHDFLNLLYPKLCYSCESTLKTNEYILCTSCLHELPIADHHLEKDNPVEKIFYGRIPVENATSLLLFEKKGMVQKLIHNLKYRGHKEIGPFLGTWLGSELKEIPAWQKITIVIPVPLHRKKLRIRGFNQVAGFGEEIAKALEVPYREDLLLKITATKTQTIKKRLARWGTIDETFVINDPGALENAHVLLVDDLVTTGATLEACAHKLLQIPNLKISIATMAVTH